MLCPVGDEALIDHAIGRLSSVVDDVAVNVHESQPLLVEHLDHRVHLSLERGEALGTAGGVGNLRGWLDGRAVVVVNGDTWCPGSLEHLVEGWDGSSIRILVAGDEPFGPRSLLAASLMPWDVVRSLPTTPAGLWEVCWRDALHEGQIETVHHHGPFVDCADAVDYLRANLASAGGSVVGEGAVVDGTLEESVVWPGGRVHASEHLRRAIRTDAGTTVLVRRDVSMRLHGDRSGIHP